MKIDALINRIAKTNRCVLRPSTGQPELPDGLSLPDDLSQFYARTGGAMLFENAKFPFEIVGPERFVRANPVIYPGLPQRAYEDYPSKNWFVISDWYITIDLNPGRLGRCYDSFWDRHAMRGSSAIVARSFTELLENLMAVRGKAVFWTKASFDPLGDAYDDVPEPVVG